jgi:hypothetical protein
MAASGAMENSVQISESTAGVAVAVSASTRWALICLAIRANLK